jgi:GNAT superfamily N-acetyltransferase
MTKSCSAVIRHAESDDAGLLAELGARLFAETFAAYNTPEDMAAYLAASFGQAQQTAELSDPRATFLIAEIDGVAVGYAKLYPGATPDRGADEKPIELVRLYASQEWLGRGVGGALMQACIDEVRQEGFRTLWLGVWEHNNRARAFYRKWKFREVGEHIFRLGDDSQTDILMALDISPGI